MAWLDNARYKLSLCMERRSHLLPAHKGVAQSLSQLDSGIDGVLGWSYVGRGRHQGANLLQLIYKAIFGV